MDIVTVSIKLLITLVLLLLYLKLSANSQLAPMTASDQVGNIVIGALAGGAITSDVSIFMLVAVIVIWAGLLVLVRALKYRSTKFSALVDGPRVQLVSKGELLIDTFEKLKLSPEDFLMSLHQQDVNSLDDVRNVWYESSGEFTVDMKGDELLSKAVISNGKVVENALDDIGKDEAWLEEQIKQDKGYSVSDIFLAEWHDGKLWIHPYHDHEQSMEMNPEA